MPVPPRRGVRASGGLGLGEAGLVKESRGKGRGSVAPDGHVPRASPPRVNNLYKGHWANICTYTCEPSWALPETQGKQRRNKEVVMRVRGEQAPPPGQAGPQKRKPGEGKAKACPNLQASEEEPQPGRFADWWAWNMES